MRMKSIAKSFMSLCVAVAVLSSCFLLGGCSDEDEKLTDSNSTVYCTENFSFSIYNEYRLSEEESDENTRRFECASDTSVIDVVESDANNASLDAYADFWNENLWYDIKIEKRVTDEGDECCCMLYCENDEPRASSFRYQVYHDGMILDMRAYINESKDADKIMKKLDDIVDSVKYTGTYDYVQNRNMYPYTIENSNFRVTVKEGFDSTTARKEREKCGESRREYHPESCSVSLHYSGAEDYEKGAFSWFIIQYYEGLDDQIKDKAQERYDFYMNMNDTSCNHFDTEISLTNLGDVFSGGNDSISRKGYNLSDIEAYCVSTCPEGADLVFECYFFEVEGIKYSIFCQYNYGDDASREELLGLFGDIEFY
ncbi:MAG: hypothetical protein ACI4EU_06245 [Butyrivibrio sp.]